MNAMPAPAATSGPAIVSAYEELRQVARGAAGQGRGAGYALFLRSGMAAWMVVCVALAGPIQAPPTRPITAGRLIPANFQIEVAVLLAEMALSVHASQGATTC